MSTPSATSGDEYQDYPAKIDEILNQRYKVEKKVGSGECSSVWRCFDKLSKQKLAIKIINKRRGSKKMAMGEIKILKSLSAKGSTDSSRRVVELLGTFTTPSGFLCLPMELLGSTLLPFAEKDGLPIELVHGIIRQILQGLEFIHSKNIVHADIKPENIAICSQQHPGVLGRLRELGFTQKSLGVQSVQPFNAGSKRKAVNEPNTQNSSSTVASKRGRIITPPPNSKRGRKAVEPRNEGGSSQTLKPQSNNVDEKQMRIDLDVKIFDFGVSFDPDKYPLGIIGEIQTVEYRCPEAILKCEKMYSTVADVWSVGCLAFELWAGELLITGVPAREDEDEEERSYMKEELLKQICQLVGPFPARMIAKCSKNQKEELKTVGREVREDPDNHLELRLSSKVNAQIRDDFTTEEISKFAEFIQSLLVIDPANRPTATACLQHNWLTTLA